MTSLLLAFSAVLLAVLVSNLAHRTVLSTEALFLAGGFLLGDGATGVITGREIPAWFERTRTRTRRPVAAGKAQDGAPPPTQSEDRSRDRPQ